MHSQIKGYALDMHGGRGKKKTKKKKKGRKKEKRKKERKKERKKLASVVCWTLWF